MEMVVQKMDNIVNQNIEEEKLRLLAEAKKRGFKKGISYMAPGSPGSYIYGPFKIKSGLKVTVVTDKAHNRPDVVCWYLIHHIADMEHGCVYNGMYAPGGPYENANTDPWGKIIKKSANEKRRQ